MASTPRNPAGALPLVSVVIPISAPNAIDRVDSLRVHASCVQLKALHYFYRCDRWPSQLPKRAQPLQPKRIEPPIKPLSVCGTRRGKPPD